MLKLLANISVFFVLFPYLVTVPTESDTQPNALIFNLLFIFYFIIIYNVRAKISKVTLIFFGVFLYSIVAPWMLDSISLRGIVPYASLVIFSLSGYWIFKKDLFSVGVFKFAVWGWLLVGLAQVFIQPQLFYFLLPRVSTTLNRGVVSLAPEPSHYGTMCLFMIIMIDLLVANGLFSKKSAVKYKLLLVFQILFLAQSFTAAFFYLIYLAICKILTINFVNFIRIVVYSFFVCLTLIFIMEKVGAGNSRIGLLLSLLFTDPMMVITDRSAVQRGADVYMSLYGFYHSLPFAFGHGTTSYKAFVLAHLDQLPSYYYTEASDRIMSGYGAALFELGYIGLVVPIVAFISFWKSRSTKMKGIGLFLLISMFSAIPLSFPFYSFLIGSSEFLRIRDDKLALENA